MDKVIVSEIQTAILYLEALSYHFSNRKFLGRFRFYREISAIQATIDVLQSILYYNEMQASLEIETAKGVINTIYTGPSNGREQ